MRSAPDLRDGPRSRPRLVFVNRYFHPDHSATSQMLSDLAFGLARLGADVHVFCSRQRYDDPAAILPKEETFGGVRIHRLGELRRGRASLSGRLLADLGFYAQAAVRLLFFLRRDDVVVAKTDPPLIAPIAACASRLRGARLVTWLQDVYPEVASELGMNPLPRWADGLLCRIRNASLRSAKANVVLGARMKERVCRLGVDASRILVIENWSAGVSPQTPEDSRLRRQVATPAEFVVGYSGNLGRGHDVDTLLGAMRLLRDEAGLRFLFIGDGAGMQALRSAAEREGLHRVSFLPYQPREQLSDAMSAANVHLASLRPELEGLMVPSKAYGILAAGRPMVFIGEADGEIPRLLRRERCGVTVAPGDHARLARKLAQLRADDTATVVMGLRARRAFLAHFTAERALRQWAETLYRLEPRALERMPVPGRALATA